MDVIMLVEDEPDNQLVIRDSFEFDEIGAELVVLDDAQRVLDAVVDYRPCLILMDIRLPGRDGLEATRLLKKDPRTREIPIWAFTSQAMKCDRRRALEAGCDRYFTKPVDIAELAARLRRFVSGRVAREAA